MDYFHKVYLSDKTLKFREINFEEYKNLQKICVESDIDLFKDYILKLLTQLSIDEIDVYSLNLIELFYIVLEVRKYSISDEKYFVTHLNGKAGNIKKSVDDFTAPVMEKYDNYVDDGLVYIELSDYIAEGVYIDPFAAGNMVKSFIVDGKEIPNDSHDILNFLPISVKNQIDDNIKKIYDDFNTIQLLSLIDENGKEVKINFEINEYFILTFLRSFLKQNLKDLYDNIYNLKRHMNVGFDEHKHLTLNEVEMYVSMFNKDIQKQNEKQNMNRNSQLPS